MSPLVAAGIGILLIVAGAAIGLAIQLARVREAERVAQEASALAEQKASDALRGRTLALAIRALDAKRTARPTGLDDSVPKPPPLLVELADRFFPTPPDAEA